MQGEAEQCVPAVTHPPSDMAGFVRYLELKHGLHWATMLDYYNAVSQLRHKQRQLDDTRSGTQLDLRCGSDYDLEEDMVPLERKIDSLRSQHGQRIRQAQRDMADYWRIWLHSKDDGEVVPKPFGPVGE